MLREVSISDAERIAKIYNYYIENTTVTFQEEKMEKEEMERRIEYILGKKYPFIVEEENGQITGYAYVNDWRPHSAYRITLESSIYLDNSFTGKGLGSTLYTELIRRAKARGIRSLIGVLSLPNEASRKIHAKMGFRVIGIFQKVGLKFGRLIDAEFWQLALQ